MEQLEIIASVTEELVRRGYNATLEYPGFICVLKYGFTFDFGTNDSDHWTGDIDAERSGGVVPTDVPSDCTDVGRIADGIAKAVRQCAPGVTDPSLSETAYGIFNDVLRAMETAEQIWGPNEAEAEYEPLMRAIAEECNQRVANYLQSK